ncbi:MAG: DUF1624 domain-containing protein [Oscillospiraceae bacterium]|nr:DUF1624 domain-containing protein [Oscillospiraceae bacterium]
MVIYHYSYNIFQIYNINLLDSIIMCYIRDFFAGVFILISGISCNFSKNNIVRGIKCFLIGILITLVTYIFLPSELIVFGILHMLGISILIYILLNNILNNIYKYINKKIIILIFLILFFMTYRIYRGYLNILGQKYFLPEIFYEIKFLFAFGFPSSSFRSADYFPVFPWTFLFLSGAVLGSVKPKESFPDFMFKSRFKFLEIIGKRTLLIYILHQPVFFIIYKLCS